MPRHPERDQSESPLSFVAARRFQWAAINATAIFQAGARSVYAMIGALGALYTKIRAAVG